MHDETLSEGNEPKADGTVQGGFDKGTKDFIASGTTSSEVPTGTEDFDPGRGESGDEGVTLDSIAGSIDSIELGIDTLFEQLNTLSARLLVIEEAWEQRHGAIRKHCPKCGQGLIGQAHGNCGGSALHTEYKRA